MNKFYDTVLSALKKDDRFFSDEGILLRNAVYEAAMQMDEKLIKLLLSDGAIKDRFFKKIDDVMVFDKIAFGWLVNNRQFLPDSYTCFKNKIGLANENGEIISGTGKVALVFPYKDCILSGGQTKDDQKRQEIFYNQTLAPDEIDRLLYPKVLVNAKRYTKDGEEVAQEFSDLDNLIIKGNNLIALSSLLKRYEGKVKCIYIDPPYNTGSDSFKYNDSFNHSTWLVFMKNRLQLARKLLSKDGSIAIYIDQNEIGYLQILLDEIFGKENRCGIITVKRGSVTGHKTINPGVVNISEYILLYSKSKEHWSPNKVYKARARNERYNAFIVNRNSPVEEWTFCSLLEAFSEFKKIDKNKVKKALGPEFEKEIMSFIIKNANAVIQFAYPDYDKVSIETRNLIDKSKKDKDNVFILHRENEADIVLKGGQRLLFYSDRLMEIDGELTTAESLSDIWDDVLPNDLHGEGNVIFKKGKKPEKAVKRIFDLLTKPGDRICDFFAGSGTMLAVAHKMNLKYVGIEQMEYVEDIMVKRINGIINDNDNKGVTKNLQWQGGGAFVYCELAKLNQIFVDEIEQAKTEEDLISTYENIINTGFINHKVNLKDIGNSADDYNMLSFADKKQFLMDLLDKNMLYINLCDIDDTEYDVSEKDKAFTRSFYKEV